MTNAREATQVHGGYGFMNEFPVARYWRDSKVLEIGEGTSEVQRMLIAARPRGLLGVLTRQVGQAGDGWAAPIAVWGR